MWPLLRNPQFLARHGQCQCQCQYYYYPISNIMVSEDGLLLGIYRHD